MVCRVDPGTHGYAAEKKYEDWVLQFQKWSRSVSLLTAVVVLTMVAGATENNSSSKVIYAYWPYWTDPSSYQPDWTVLTHVAYHSWNANSDGTLVAPSDINRYNTVQNIAHQHGVKLIISVECFDKDTLDSIFAYHSEDLANNILYALQTYGADGVDLDFEHPRNTNIYTGQSNVALYENLMRILYTKLKSQNPDYYITLNIAGSVEEVYRNANLSNYTDAVFLRGYNYHSSSSTETGAPSPYKAVVRSVDLLKNYYSLNKIILGLYFSGYDWPSSSGEPGASTTGKGAAIPMKDAIAGALIHGRLWDSNSSTPWYRYQSGGEWHQTWYDDDESLGLKLDYVNSENIGGAGFWALGYEGNNVSIWNVVKYTFSAGPGTTPTPTAKPTATPKTPAFDALLSISALLIAILVRRCNTS